MAVSTVQPTPPKEQEKPPATYGLGKSGATYGGKK